MSNKIGFIIAASVSFILFLVLMIIVVTDKSISFDNDVWRFFINHRGHKKNATYYFAHVFTQFGFVVVLLIIALILGILFKFDERFFYLLLVVLATVGINYILKLIIDRPRPASSFMWAHETSGSFPSGHSATASVSYISLILVLWFKTDFKKSIKIILTVIGAMLIIIVPITRLILGVHYFTDVVGGVLLGTLGATSGFLIGYPLVELIYNNIKQKIKKSE